MLENIDTQIGAGEAQARANHVRASSNEALRDVKNTIGEYRSAQVKIDNANKRKIKEIDLLMSKDRKRRLDEERHLGFRREAEDVLE